uniref:G-protein coupled receptors family 1 profile domain-containing protein n=1 Tax=Oreochromis aureus TaxID=47969 RepID=A0AAZ1X2K9_OREAU
RDGKSLTTISYGNNNNTNETHCPDHELWEWLTAHQPVYILLITVLGIMLNMFVLIVFCFHKKACTIAEIYLSNLAAADLVLVSCLPFWAVNMLNDFNWPFGHFMCKVINVGIKMNAYCSIYFLVLVSIDRYVALVHAMSHGRMRSPKYAKLGCLLTWGLGLLLSIPVFIFRELGYFPEYGTVYQLLVYELTTIIFSFIIPFFIIFLCTLKIIQALRNRPNGHGTEQKATTLILVVLLAFLICWGPFQLSRILDLFERLQILKHVGILGDHKILVCKQITVYLAFFNSVLNPILYVTIGKNFQKKAKELFISRKYKKTRRSSIRFSRTRFTSVKSDIVKVV